MLGTPKQVQRPMKMLLQARLAGTVCIDDRPTCLSTVVSPLCGMQNDPLSYDMRSSTNLY